MVVVGLGVYAEAVFVVVENDSTRNLDLMNVVVAAVVAVAVVVAVKSIDLCLELFDLRSFDLLLLSVDIHFQFLPEYVVVAVVAEIELVYEILVD